MKADLGLAQEGSLPQEHSVARRLRFWRRSFAKHKWGALGVALVVVLVTTYVVFSATPIYRGTATLLLEPSKPKLVSIEDVYNRGGGNREYFQTQVEILKSRDLHKRLVRKLKLVQPGSETAPVAPAPSLPWLPAEWQPSEWLPSGWLTTESSAVPRVVTEEERIEAAAAGIGGGLFVQPVRGSQLVRISYESADKELAAKIPNALAQVYIESDLEARLQMTQQASAWINERLGGLRAKLAASEQALQAYRDRERIVDVKGLSLSGAGNQLTDLNTRLVAARQKRAEAEIAYAQLQDALKTNKGVETIPAVQRNPTVQKYRDAEVEAERKVYELSQRYLKEHPRMIAAEAELKTTRENARRQVELIVTGITRDYEATRAQEDVLDKAVNAAKSTIQDANRKEFQLGVLERDVAANRQLYDMFLNRFRETNVGTDLQSTAARVVDYAIVPNTPVKPEKGKALLIALLAGLTLGGMLAFLLEYLDNTVKNSEDVESKLGVPLLGVLQKLKKGGDQLHHAVLADSQSMFSESVRTVRTSVMMAALDNPHKVLLVTSSVPEEGKTTVAMNLAFAFAQVKKVCLIDADMRRPSVAKNAGLDRAAPGLSNLVAGTESPAACIHLDAPSGVHIIPAGIPPPNPQELLSSRRFSEVLKKLHDMFDIVIIDSPPIQLVSDALILSSHANALLYVVKADATPHQVAKGGIERLSKVGAPILGVVLNQLDLQKADRYYGYGKYSAYGKSYKYYGYREAT